MQKQSKWIVSGVCQQCGASFERKQTVGKARYCTRACANRATRAARGAAKKKASDIDRFWSCVDKSGECWRWLGQIAHTRDGDRAVFRSGSRTNSSRRLEHATRWLWRYLFGAI